MCVTFLEGKHLLVLFMHPKIQLFKKQIYTQKLKKEDDNPRQFDSASIDL